MGALRAFLKKNPLAGWALVVMAVAIVGYLVFGQLAGPGPRVATPPQAGGNVDVVTPLPPAPRPASSSTAGPSPSTVARATPAAGPTPVTATQPAPASKGTATTSSSAISSVVTPGPTGRADPFIPLVRPAIGGGQPPAPPPLVTLPPPPLPGGTVPPGVTPGAVPAAGPSAGIAITGIVGDTGSVAVVVVNGRTEVLSEGEAVGTLRVVKIDHVRRLVKFSRAGTQFDVRMGGE